MDEMVAQSCRAMGDGFMSPKEYKLPGMECFDWEKFGRRMMIRYYCDVLMYAHSYGKEDMKRCRERVKSCRVKEFQTYAVPISDGLKGCNGRSCCIWILPASLNSISLY